MISKNDFEITRIMDGTFRVTRTDIPGDHHSHFKSRNLANKVIANVCNDKIPLNSRNYTLISMYRLSNDEKYRNKIQLLLDTRKQKQNKGYYYNPAKKK